MERDFKRRSSYADFQKRLIVAWYFYLWHPGVDNPLRPTDPHIMCRKCWRPKSPEDFNGYHNRTGEFVRRPICKACHLTLFGRPRGARLRAASAVRRAERQQHLKKCRRCGKSSPISTWAHLPSGHIHNHCPDCDAEFAAVHAAQEAARARGYRSDQHTPEYRRLQREREAERKGQQLSAYVPQAEKERLASLKRAEQMADRHRTKMFRLLLDQYDWIADQNREITDAERAAWAARQREYYARHQQQEVARHLAWKQANPDRISEYGRTRAEREREAADGTVNKETIAQLKLRATRCAYCDGLLTRKETDHMTPVCLGGEHSLRNIVIVCPCCNGKKHTLSYAQWIDRVEPEHRARVVALWLERFGDVAA